MGDRMGRCVSIFLCGWIAACGGVSGSEDSDGDGITNKDEGWSDDLNTDQDDFEDWLDLDSDGEESR